MTSATEDILVFYHNKHSVIVNRYKNAIFIKSIPLYLEKMIRIKRSTTVNVTFYVFLTILGTICCQNDAKRLQAVLG